MNPVGQRKGRVLGSAESRPGRSFEMENGRLFVAPPDQGPKTKVPPGAERAAALAVVLVPA